MRLLRQATQTHLSYSLKSLVGTRKLRTKPLPPYLQRDAQTSSKVSTSKYSHRVLLGRWEGREWSVKGHYDPQGSERD